MVPKKITSTFEDDQKQSIEDFNYNQRNAADTKTIANEFVYML